MKTKTNKQQLEGVALLLSYLLINYKPIDKQEKLVFIHVSSLYAKIRAKVDALIAPRSGFSVNMTDAEAIALSIFLDGVATPEEHYRYEKIQLQLINNEIDKAYG